MSAEQELAAALPLQSAHQNLPPRPKLEVAFPSCSQLCSPSNIPFSIAGIQPNGSGTTDSWTELVSGPAYAPLASWQYVMEQLILHPERNSTNILRADINRETHSTLEHETHPDWRHEWTIRRTILPRRPNLDWEMQQDCSLYLRANDDGINVDEALIVYTPLIGSRSHPRMTLPVIDPLPEVGTPPPCEAFVPFYHPKVRALAFQYKSEASTPLGDSPIVFGRLSISLVPFPPQPTSFPGTHKLSRVGLSLLTTLHMHTWGHMHSYQKRVHHDQVVPRDRYQDLYLSLKHKYAAQLIEGWKEVTDPQKHVFEDIGIAAFLICLWRIMFSSENPYDAWKEKVHFVDVGCGNGLLTHILALEGFKGVGLDLRERKSWQAYQDAGTRLREWTFEPSSLLGPAVDESWQGGFLIGNHADELTPWIPLLATHHNATGFINIPCCYYALEGGKNFPLTLKRPKTSDATLTDAAPSRNQQYLAYISNLTQEMGWRVELEALRIPSTKNWALIGRTLTQSADQTARRREVLRKVEQVHQTWTARTTSAAK